MTEATLFLPGLSPVGGKTITATFDGGKLSSNGGVLILREIERKLGLAAVLSRHIPDDRDRTRITVTYGDPLSPWRSPRPCSKKAAFKRPIPAGLTVHGKPLDA
jgi:Transposase DDE domain group 1